MTKINTRNELDPRTLENSWKLPVLSSIDTPPVSPVNGARYRIIATATGEWEGKENQIAIYDADNVAWFYETYGEGSVVYDFNANDYRYVKADLSWEQFDKIPLAISDVTGLQSALDDKLESPIAISDVTDLQTSLDAKEPLLPSKTGNSLKVLRVNAGEDGFEFAVISGVSSFADNVFDVHDEADVTKIMKLDIGTNVSTETTVTKKIQDGDGTFAELEGDQVFDANVQAETMNANDSLTTDKVVLPDSATDPLVDGEIQNNGGVVKVKSNGTVRNVGLSAEDDLTINGVTKKVKEWFFV